MSYYYMVSPRSDYLAHYGVKERSGRYKWGTGERPRQRLEQPKRMGFFARRKEQKRQAEILAKKKQLLEEKQRKDEEKARFEAEKQRIISEASPVELKKYAVNLTTKEMEEAVNRIKWMTEINKFAASEEKRLQGKSTFDQFDDLMTKLGKVNKWGDIAIDSYRNVKEVTDFIQKSAAEAVEARESGIKNKYIREVENRKKKEKEARIREEQRQKEMSKKEMENTLERQLLAMFLEKEQQRKNKQKKGA